MSVQLVLATATMVVRENMEFHLNVNVHCEVYSRIAHDGQTLERKILLPNLKSVPKVFSRKSNSTVAIVNTRLAPQRRLKNKKRNAKKNIYSNPRVISINARA